MYVVIVTQYYFLQCVYFIVFGPPHFTLNCSADYVMPSKIVEVSWKPTLTLSALASNLTTADVIYRIQNCEAMIKCNGDHKDVVSTILHSS